MTRWCDFSRPAAALSGFEHLPLTRDTTRRSPIHNADAYIPGIEGLFDFNAPMAGVEGLFDVNAVMDRWTTAPSEAVGRVLDIYETMVQQMADAHVTAARAFDNPAITMIAEKQAALGREMADAYLRSIRRLFEF